MHMTLKSNVNHDVEVMKSYGYYAINHWQSGLLIYIVPPVFICFVSHNPMQAGFYS